MERGNTGHIQAAGADEAVVWVRPLVTLFVLGALLVLAVLHLDTVVMVLLGLLAAATVAALLRPVVERIPLPRGISAAITEVGLIGAIVGLGWLVWWSLSGPMMEQFGRWPEMKRQIDAFFAGWSRQLGIREGAITVDSILNQAAQFIGGGEVADLLARLSEILTSVLIWLAFIFFGSMYLLSEPPDRLRKPMLRLLPPPKRPRMDAALDELEPKLRWWLLGTFLSMVVVGTLAGVGFWLVGLEFWLGLALLAAVAELVPTLGPAAAFLVALLFGAAQGGNTVIGVTVVWLVTVTFESYILIPLVMREAVNIPPVVTIFTVVLWASALGPAGLLLALPINVTIWTMVRHFVYSKGDLKRSEKDESG